MPGMMKKNYFQNGDWLEAFVKEENPVIPENYTQGSDGAGWISA